MIVQDLSKLRSVHPVRVNKIMEVPLQQFNHIVFPNWVPQEKNSIKLSSATQASEKIHVKQLTVCFPVYLLSQLPLISSCCHTSHVSRRTNADLNLVVDFPTSLPCARERTVTSANSYLGLSRSLSYDGLSTILYLTGCGLWISMHFHIYSGRRHRVLKWACFLFFVFCFCRRCWTFDIAQ